VYGQSVNLGITFGVTSIALISTNIIPLEENGKAGLLADENWRIVFSYSILLNVISILLIAIKFQNPSLKDYIRDKSDEIAIKELGKIYTVEKSEDLLAIKKKIFADTVETAETSIPFKEAYFSRKYRFS